MNKCPKCKSSWQGEPIPDRPGEFYGRQIGIEVSELYDGLCAIRCPDCHSTFPVSEHPVDLWLFERFRAMGGADAP